jgi:hypothetical protein
VKKENDMSKNKELAMMWADYARRQVTEPATDFLAMSLRGGPERHTIHLYEEAYAPPGKKVVVTFAVVEEDWDE